MNVTVRGAEVTVGGIEVEVTTEVGMTIEVAGAHVEVTNRNKIKIESILHKR